MIKSILDNGLFITGTDTGVGKTIVAGAIAAYLRHEGKAVGVMKPAETGCIMKEGELYPADAAFLKRASGTDDVMGAICPCRFAEPLAPSVAAGRAKKTIDARLIAKIFRAIKRQHDVTIVEGAGGLMVPLCGGYLYIDLAADLGLPIVVVARAGLGAINHTLLTVSAARSRGLDIYGIILNQSTRKPKGVAEKTNPDVIRDLAGTGRVFTLPYAPGVKRSKGALLALGGRLDAQGFFGLTKK